MINVVALALLVSSLAAAGVWSPPPKPNDPPLIREGHRLIIVEYERHVPSGSPPPTPVTTTAQDIIQEAKEKFQEASSLLPNVGQGISVPESSVLGKPTHSAKDLICDAYGSCKEKISSLVHKGKDKISSKVSDIDENAKDAVKSTIEKASEIEESVKGAVKSKMESTKDTIKNTVESTKDAGEHVVGNISRAVGNAVDRAEEAANLLNLTDTISRVKDFALDAVKYVKAPETARTAASIAHLLAFAVAYGTCVWVTFVSSHVLAMALPRQQFGMVQSKLYPVYFRAVACGIGIACLGHFFEKRVVGVERVQGYNLLAALGLVLVNMFYLEPKATKVMFERMKMEKEEGRGQYMADVLGEPAMTTSTTTATTATTQSATTIGVTRTTMAVDQDAVKSRVAKLNKKLKKLNKYSSFVNIVTLMSLTWHLVHLARRLQMTC